MKSKRLLVPLVIILTCGLLHADPIIHKFELWGKWTNVEKLNFYWGWTEGYLMARGEQGRDLGVCLESISTVQALSMIDKYQKSHPEEWSKPLGEEILKALAVSGGPCEGQDKMLSPH